jgi:hypothetical protein
MGMKVLESWEYCLDYPRTKRQYIPALVNKYILIFYGVVNVNQEDFNRKRTVIEIIRNQPRLCQTVRKEEAARARGQDEGQIRREL